MLQIVPRAVAHPIPPSFRREIPFLLVSVLLRCSKFAQLFSIGARLRHRLALVAARRGYYLKQGSFVHRFAMATRLVRS